MRRGRIARRTIASRRATAPGSKTADSGAVAVEFALILPVLMLFLFGVIQYGYGLFQLQSFSAALNEASRQASTGITDCAGFTSLLDSVVSQNGLSPGDVNNLKLEWLDRNNTVTQTPELLGQVRITATYEPFNIGLPLLPFPGSITRSSTAGIQSVLSPNLTGCLTAALSGS